MIIDKQASSCSFRNLDCFAWIVSTVDLSILSAFGPTCSGNSFGSLIMGALFETSTVSLEWF